MSTANIASPLINSSIALPRTSGENEEEAVLSSAAPNSQQSKVAAYSNKAETALLQGTLGTDAAVILEDESEAEAQTLQQSMPSAMHHTHRMQHLAQHLAQHIKTLQRRPLPKSGASLGTEDQDEDVARLDDLIENLSDASKVSKETDPDKIRQSAPELSSLYQEGGADTDFENLFSGQGQSSSLPSRPGPNETRKLGKKLTPEFTAQLNAKLTALKPELSRSGRVIVAGSSKKPQESASSSERTVAKLSNTGSQSVNKSFERSSRPDQGIINLKAGLSENLVSLAGASDLVSHPQNAQIDNHPSSSAAFSSQATDKVQSGSIAKQTLKSLADPRPLGRLVQFPQPKRLGQLHPSARPAAPSQKLRSPARSDIAKIATSSELHATEIQTGGFDEIAKTHSDQKGWSIDSIEQFREMIKASMGPANRLFAVNTLDHKTHVKDGLIPISSRTPMPSVSALRRRVSSVDYIYPRLQSRRLEFSGQKPMISWASSAMTIMAKVAAA